MTERSENPLPPTPQQPELWILARLAHGVLRAERGLWSWIAGSQPLFAASWVCKPRGLGSLSGEGHRELGDRLIEARGLAAGDAVDINLSSRNGQVNASPVLGLMT